MLSNRSNKALVWHAIVIVAVVLACSGAPVKMTAQDRGDHGSFQRAHKDLRDKLKTQTGDSGVVFDDSTIFIGVVPNGNGSPNASRDPSEMRIKANKGATLTWACWDGKFRLDFVPTATGKESPLEGMETKVEGGDSVPSVASAVVRSDAGVGHYYFSVHVDLADGTKYDDPSCPPIIIEP